MTAMKIPSDEGNHSESFYRDNSDESERNRKRRRPQHENIENSSPLTSREYPPTLQETHVQRYRGCRGRSRYSCSSPLAWWIALVFACCQKQQCFISSVVAQTLRETTNDQKVSLKEHHRRYLQNGGNSASLDSASIKYLEGPTSLWTSKTSRDAFYGGNELRVSPFDKGILYATNQAGDLRVFDATNGRSIETVSPRPRTLTEDGTTSTWSLYSNSGMAFGSFPGTSTTSEQTSTDDDSTGNDDGYNDYLQFLINNGIEQNQNKDEEATRTQEHFAVYSIVDKAPETSRFLPKTRVICVSIPEHKVLWSSAGLPGTPNGSPVVYYTDEATMKDTDNVGVYVALTHNSVLIKPNNQTQTTGHVTVLDPTNGHVKWTQSEWSRDEVPKGYGPPQVSHKPALGGGNSGGSLQNKNDVIIWTSSEDEGRGKNGNLFSFQMKSSFELEAEQNNNSTLPVDPFEIRVLKKVRWNSIARPALNQDGTTLFIGVTGNAVRGWNGIAKFNETANWSNQLVPLDGTVPSLFESHPTDVIVSTAPVLSTDEERLFVVTVRNETVCLNVRTGVRMWAAKTRHSSPILSEPKASPDNQRLYVVNSKDGKLHSFDQMDGRTLWSFGCGEHHLPSSDKCIFPQVYANFALSYDGTVLYYGATDGRIAALTLGHPEKDEPPSVPTTVTIDFDDDSRGPLEFDTSEPDTSESDRKKSDVNSAQAINNINVNENVGLKIAGTITAIIVCLAVAILSVMYVVRSKGIALSDLRNYRLPRYGKDEKRHSYVTRLDGPDNYEDQIIARMSEDEESIEQQFNTLWVDPTHSDPKYYYNDDEETTADRLSILLGTSNRIAPISENFGYGQAVLL